MDLKKSATSRANFAKDKKGKQMDRLTRECLEAQRMGMSYGQYKAWQKDHGLGEPAAPREPFLIDPKEKVELVCVVCGEKFMAYHRARKYCSPECKGKAERLRYREQKGLPTDLNAPKICIVCGKEIVNRPGAIKYCSVECSQKVAVAAYQQRQKEAQKHGSD